jgi:hypothetical protein
MFRPICDRTRLRAGKESPRYSWPTYKLDKDRKWRNICELTPNTVNHGLHHTHSYSCHLSLTVSFLQNPSLQQNGFFQQRQVLLLSLLTILHGTAETLISISIIETDIYVQPYRYITQSHYSIHQSNKKSCEVAYCSSICNLAWDLNFITPKLWTVGAQVDKSVIEIRKRYGSRVERNIYIYPLHAAAGFWEVGCNSLLAIDLVDQSKWPIKHALVCHKLLHEVRVG